MLCACDASKSTRRSPMRWLFPCNQQMNKELRRRGETKPNGRERHAINVVCVLLLVEAVVRFSEPRAMRSNTSRSLVTGTCVTCGRDMPRVLSSRIFSESEPSASVLFSSVYGERARRQIVRVCVCASYTETSATRVGASEQQIIFARVLTKNNDEFILAVGTLRPAVGKLRLL